MLDWVPSAPYTAEQLLEVLRILRDPENGCPWDKVQTHASIRKNFLEETCEVLEAIDADDPAMLREELGDVLMQVAFHAVIEEERGRFTFEDVCREVCEKLVFRHPNIFASSAAQNAGINGWDALKNKEKGRTTPGRRAEHGAGHPAGPHACPEAAEACGALRCAGAGRNAGTAGSAAGCGRLERCAERRRSGGVAVCSGQRHAAGRCGRRRGADLCVQAVLRCMSAAGTTRYSGGCACPDRRNEVTQK